jgi:hypothetical protein
MKTRLAKKILTRTENGESGAATRHSKGKREAAYSQDAIRKATLVVERLEERERRNAWRPIPESVKSLPHVQSVLQDGYEIRFSEEVESICCKPFSCGSPVGYFSLMRETRRVRACQASVDAPRRGKGIASACYLCVGKLTGFTFEPGSIQSSDGGTLWAKLKGLLLWNGSQSLPRGIVPGNRVSPYVCRSPRGTLSCRLCPWPC